MMLNGANEGEVELVQALRVDEKLIDGRIHTKDTIIHEYENMVHYYSQKRRKYAASIGFEYQDLVAEGFIGLLKAFEAFDERKGFKFSAIARHYIFGEIRKSYRDRGDTGANYSRQIKEFAYRIQKEELEGKAVEDIVKETGIKNHHVSRALDYSRNRTPARFDAVIQQDDGSGVTLWELYSEPTDPSKEDVEEFLQGLDLREEVVARMLIDGEPQRVISKVLSISQMQVSRTKSIIKEKYLVFKDGE